MRSFKKKIIAIGFVGLLVTGLLGITAFASGRSDNVSNNTYAAQCVNSSVCNDTDKNSQCVNNGVCNGTGRQNTASYGHHYNTSRHCR